MSEIFPGAVLQYTAAVTDTITLNPAQVISAVGQVLSPQGITVQASNYTTPSLLDQAEILAVQSFSLPFNCTLSVGVQGNYGSENDVQSIVDNAFYQVTGQLPTSSSIPQIVSNPGGAGAGSTGQASQTPFASTGSGLSSIGDAFSGFFNSLSTGSTFAIIAVIVIIVVIIAIALLPDAPARVIRSFA